VEVFHPRFLVGPGYLLRSFESLTYYWGVGPLVSRLRQSFPFDLIHAHFVYPDGVVAARLGKRYGVPVVITEQAPWLSWMEKSGRVRRQSLEAVRDSAFVVAVSRAVRDSIERLAGTAGQLRIIPNAVDDATFTPAPERGRAGEGQILFVGIFRFVKGLDVLLSAIRQLLERGRRLKLVVVGESFYRSYRREEERLRRMVPELGLERSVAFVGPKSPEEVARYMQASDLVVLPSRAESFGQVLVEALACGTPVVATRCGGPEDIVNDGVGVLVEPENPEALARGIEYVLERRGVYDPARLRAYAVENFGMQSVGRRIAELYQEALARRA
jgi:glycosyltransferase involved in cell wall biosynthesis